MGREEDLENELRSKNDRLWDLILDQINENKHAVGELREKIGKNKDLIKELETDVKILATKIAAIVSIVVLVVEYALKKLLH